MNHPRSEFPKNQVPRRPELGRNEYLLQLRNYFNSPRLGEPLRQTRAYEWL